MNKLRLASIASVALISFPHYAIPKQHSSLDVPDVHRMSKLLTDYSGIHKSSTDYYEVWPTDAAGVARVVKSAYMQNIPIRIQGNSHSQSGISLPRKKELLLHTSRMNKIVFNKEGEVYAEAGVPILMLKNYLEDNTGYSIPVTNEGGVGPTVGGFVSAGGISYKSSVYGGFWNNVIDIDIISADGFLRNIKRDDKVFPWLFGSMGQLGVITGAHLKLERNIYKPISGYPLNTIQRLSFVHEDYAGQDHSPLYWFNIFVPVGHAEKAREELEKFEKTIANMMNVVPIYSWTVQNNDFPAPLLSPAKNFVAMGVWGTAKNRKDILEIEKRFTAWAKERKFKRYIQAELTASPEFFEEYFGKSVYDEFYRLKETFDPKFLFNRNIVFANR